jgi:hypothetical protein
MKKFVAIFFIAVIGMFFASSTVYAYGFLNKVAVIAKSPVSTGGLMSFELEDGFEEVIHYLDAGLTEYLKISFGRHSYRSKLFLSASTSGEFKITRSIYLSYHKLLI